VDSKYAVFDILARQPIINGWQDCIVLLLCIVLGLRMIQGLINKFNAKGHSFFFALYLLHLFITLYFYFITKNAYSYADSAHYYLRIVSPESYYDPTIRFGIGTQFIKLIVYVLYEWISLSYLSCFLIFSTLGFAGMYLFLLIVYDSGARVNHKFLSIPVIPFLLFLPNIHMWTVALGKDSLIFYALMLFTFSLMKIKKRVLLLIISGFIIFMIRPHVFGLVMAAVFITIFIWGDISFYLKIPALMIFGMLGIFALNFLVENTFGRSLSIANVIDILEGRQGYYAKAEYGGSVVNTANYPFLYKVFSYLYRPIFERFNFNYIFVSLDNLGSLFFTLSIFSKGFFRWLKQSMFYERFSIVFFIVGVSFFSLIFSNFGIAVRQKTMFIFSLYIPLVSFLAWRRSAKSSLLLRYRTTNTGIVA
jgi:hypothetical protein